MESWFYDGEVDQFGKTCGYGTIKSKNEHLEIHIEGTWLNDEAHGISKQLSKKYGSIIMFYRYQLHY